MTNSIFPRWSVKRLDRDLLEAAVAAKTWSAEDDEWSANEWANWLGTTLMEILDVATTRAKSGYGPACYWWSEEIAELRRKCNKHRRRAFRAKGKAPLEAQAILDSKVRDSRKALRRAITKAKGSAWEELLTTLNEDPWGKPYRIVTKKLRNSGPPICESLPSRMVENIVDTLFPKCNIATRREIPEEWEEEWAVTENEVAEAIGKIGSNKAPGPDGIMGTAIKITQEWFLRLWCQCFNRCLKEGIYFPW